MVGAGRSEVRRVHHQTWLVVRWRPTVCAHDAGSTPQAESWIGQSSRPDVALNCWQWVKHLVLRHRRYWELGGSCESGDGFVRGGAGRKNQRKNFALNYRHRAGPVSGEKPLLVISLQCCLHPWECRPATFPLNTTASVSSTGPRCSFLLNKALLAARIISGSPAARIPVPFRRWSSPTHIIGPKIPGLSSFSTSSPTAKMASSETQTETPRPNAWVGSAGAAGTDLRSE